MSRLAGKTALVTGATSGIGRAVAEGSPSGGLRTHTHTGWTTLAPTAAAILAELASSTFIPATKESTWL
jgi:NAD(P)-dependent dehydrogenase (short-subunit alcohol dehydrogenase family)